MMLASAGSAVLAGCGGGGGGSSDSQAAGKTSASTNPASSTTSTPSTNGTPVATTTAANTTASTSTSNATQPANTNANDASSQAPAASDGLFYGINGHMAWGEGIYMTMPPAAQLAILQDLGVTNYRCDIADGGMATTLANALKGPFANSGVSILPVFNPLSAHWDPHSSEADAYALGYDLAVRCTRPLKGLVKYIECGNELDVDLKIAGDGSSRADWDPACWPSFRGALRGMIDGVRAIDPTIQCGVNVGIPMAYGALQMLWNGISPDGTVQGVSGAASLRWDFTSYHWYKSSGDIQCGGRNNACIDVLQVLKDSFNVPIWLTEWGWSGANDTPQSAAAYTSRALTQYRAIKDKYNIQSIMMYAVMDRNYGLMQLDGVTKNPAYAVFKDFIAANPV
ncbi:MULTISPECIES: glycosyl hydrolase [unclassified Caballeronia]|uniref:glycosyl hydrolase n=1 Tax=unclassified Caballeronia TaxID=2646786 RepID=UPI00285A577C|nr:MULTISPECIES: glycosyl hydrolase [unclassified Caballeronia]MDR5740736.1 glycosyl hydrolase [Caballeronia sp. LZ016]MDR5808741.1 glycosyl hydrolase [Caballeronia sp. LZ019]